MGMIPTFIALITIIVAGAVTVSGTFFSESSHVVESLAQDADRVQELRGTRIELIGASYASPYADLVFRNTGRVAHSDFDRWDVWASFHEADGSYHPERLTYSSTAGSSPAADEWVIEGIYLDADAGIAESSQPGIFGPSEEVRVRLHVDPAAGDPQVNSVTVGLANGVTAKAGFTWEALATVPADVGAGGSLTNDGTYVYGLMGGNASDFGRYDPSSASWTSLTDAPWTPRGGAMAYATDAGAGYVYGFRGENQLDFDQYDIEGGGWSAMVDPPDRVGAGGALAWDGVQTIYAMAGGATDLFWSYDVAGNSWSTLATTPANVDAGGALVYLSRSVYALGGGGTQDFWRYDAASGGWSTLANTPAAVAEEGALATDGTDLYALPGNNTTALWKYSVERDTWTSLPTTPAAVRLGAALTALGGVLYGLRGDITPDFWGYLLPTYRP